MEERYFEPEQSIGEAANYRDKEILRIIGDHFMGNHPPVPFQFKMDFFDGIKCGKDGRYQFNIGERFPQAVIGSKCLTEGRIFSYGDRTAVFDISSIGPTSCSVNEEMVYVSAPDEEGLRQAVKFKAAMRKGWNLFSFCTEKSERGFGFMFGNAMPQWEPYLFQSPLRGREGQLGFVYSEPFTEKRGAEWYPRIERTSAAEQFVPDDVFPEGWKGYVYGLAVIHAGKKGTLLIEAEADRAMEHLRVCLDGIWHTPAVDGRRWSLPITDGKEHTLVMEIYRREACSGHYTVKAEEGYLECPQGVKGYDGIWLYQGPYGEGRSSELSCKNVLYDSAESAGQDINHWRTGIRNGVLRMCVESELFGRWTYPMGVTLYGLLENAAYLGDTRTENYVKRDVEQITANQEYALYDKEQFGFPGINQQICWLSELDDCGSFGSLMLECHKRWPCEASRILADTIGHYMKYEQKREADGAFSRGNDTMWIDDLYMSVPFLTRYAQMSGDNSYLDEACRQILCFKKRFFIADQRLMSHIYDVKWQCANKIPWSRGNGWVLFSLSELLAVLPESHEAYGKIRDFYCEMVRGIIQVQGENGLWHQVLDDSATYEESSSTAMFLAAFARGLRRKYAASDCAEQMRESVYRAWKGLITRAVDCNGNLYGVCQGSGCSFSREYYRDLSWRYNDPHGIGIVLLAGVEKCRLDEMDKTPASAAADRCYPQQ